LLTGNLIFLTKIKFKKIPTITSEEIKTFLSRKVTTNGTAMRANPNPATPWKKQAKNIDNINNNSVMEFVY